jgi:hypothetical protein
MAHDEAENEDNVSDGCVHCGFSGEIQLNSVGVRKVHRSKPDVR